MKYVILIILAVSLNIILSSAQGLIINHSCTNLSAIPDNWIDSAKVKLRITYQHTSHGSQLVSGIEAIKKTYGGIYDFTSTSNGLHTGIFLNDYGMPDAGDLGQKGDLSWKNATISILERQECDRNLVMWSWCGGVSYNDSAGIYTYLNAMDDLETNYPSTKFVYMTGHLNGTGENGNLNKMNQLIRNYCTENDKILFDFADIESYSPDNIQNFMEWCALDGLNYDASCNNASSGPNWGKEWVDANPNHPYIEILNNCSSCAHSSDPAEAKLNCVLKGNAFWWMLACLAGWDQTTGFSELNAIDPELKVFPNPSSGRFTIVTNKRIKKIDVFNADGIKSNPIINMQGPTRYNVTISSSSKGLYFIHVYCDKLHTEKLFIQ